MPSHTCIFFLDKDFSRIEIETLKTTLRPITLTEMAKGLESTSYFQVESFTHTYSAIVQGVKKNNGLVCYYRLN